MGRFQIGILEDVINADWVGVFWKAKAIGFDGVELGIRADTFRNTELWSDEGIESLASRSEEAGIPIFSVCLHTFWKFTFADPDVSNRIMAKQIACQAIKACQAIGIPNILIPVTNPLGLVKEEAAHRWAYETRGIAAEAEKQGVHIGLENVGRSHIVTGDQMLGLLQAVDSPNVGTYFDVGNAQMLGSNSIADIRTLKDHLVQIHIKDPRSDRAPCLLGEGEIDLEGCLRALTEVGYSGPLVFETPGLQDPLETADRNLATLRSLIESLEGC